MLRGQLGGVAVLRHLRCLPGDGFSEKRGHGVFGGLLVYTGLRECPAIQHDVGQVGTGQQIAQLFAARIPLI